VKIRSVWLTRFIGWSAACLAKALFCTYRFTSHTEQAGTDPSSHTPRTWLYSLWHDEIMIPLAARCRRGGGEAAALASRHQDGSYLVEFMRHMRIRGVRGSRNHGGDQALRELLRVLSCAHVFITPDGPRGPKHELKDGIVFLASQTGTPVIPCASYAPRSWTIKGNWTDLSIPKPFARVYYYLGSPIAVPPNLSREQLAEWRGVVQSEMNRVRAAVQDLANGKVPSPAGDLVVETGPKAALPPVDRLPHAA
jgi:lysophospholipid acyltransferase (LPLAT)-like uncharacterized protein